MNKVKKLVNEISLLNNKIIKIQQKIDKKAKKAYLICSHEKINKIITANMAGTPYIMYECPVCRYSTSQYEENPELEKKVVYE